MQVYTGYGYSNGINSGTVLGSVVNPSGLRFLEIERELGARAVLGLASWTDGRQESRKENHISKGSPSQQSFLSGGGLFLSSYAGNAHTAEH